MNRNQFAAVFRAMLYHGALRRRLSGLLTAVLVLGLCLAGPASPAYAANASASTVRLAKSNADMWVPILAQNRDNVLQVIDTYIEKMKSFRDAIDDMDEGRIRGLIEDANKIKRIIR